METICASTGASGEEEMGKTILVTGGARSGKSRLAEQLAEACGAPLGYIATATAGDAEMAARISRHQERRGDRWQTIEEPLELSRVLAEHDGRHAALLVDCVTLWLTNLLLCADDPAPAVAAVKELTRQLPGMQSTVVLVTNEVGQGIVPENRLARIFRDLSGEANQLLAAAADEVYVTIAGLPLRLK